MRRNRRFAQKSPLIVQRKDSVLVRCQRECFAQQYILVSHLVFHLLALPRGGNGGFNWFVPFGGICNPNHWGQAFE